MASHSSTGGKGKVNQVSTNVSVARELNHGPWRLNHHSMEKLGAAGNCIETSQTKSPEGILSVFRVLSMLTLNVNV